MQQQPMQPSSSYHVYNPYRQQQPMPAPLHHGEAHFHPPGNQTSLPKSSNKRHLPTGQNTFMADEDSAPSDDGVGGPIMSTTKHRIKLGQIGSRRSTDSRVRVIFWSVICLAIFSASYSTNSRNIFASFADLTKVTNYQGLACGSATNVEHLPFLYYPLETSTVNNRRLRADRGMCVSRCPNAKDVAAKGVLAVPEIGYAAEETAGSAVSLLYKINSPLYATYALGNGICFPRDAGLQQEFATVLQKTNALGARFLAGGIIQGFPRALMSLIVGVALGATLAALTRAAVGAVVMFSLASCIFMSLLGGFYFMGFALSHSSSTSGSAELTGGIMAKIFSTHFHGLIYSSMILLLVAFVLSLLLLLNWQHLAAACRMLQVSKATVHDNAGVLNYSASLFSLATVILEAVFFLVYFAIMAGKDNGSFEAPSSLSLNPNGGISIFPLYRQPIARATSSLVVVLWTFACLWAIELLIVLGTFVGVYAGVIALVNESNYPAAGTTSLAGRALSTALRCHIGTLAASAFSRGISRPVDMIFFGVATRFQLASNVNSCVDVVERFGDLDTGTCALIRDMVDANSNIALAETAITGADFKSATRRALRYVNRGDHPLAKYIGLGSLITWSCTGFVGLFTFVTLTWSLLQQGPLGKPETILARGFVSSPLFSAAIVALATTALVAPFFTLWSGYGDGLLYMTIKSACEAPQTWHGPGNSMIPPNCPDPIKQLIEMDSIAEY